MMSRTFRAHADAKDFNAHMDWLMAGAERLHDIGEKAYIKYRRCYREMEQIVDEMKRTRKASERLFP